MTGGLITTIAVVSGGSGYTSVPTVTISGGGGTGASAIANVVGGVVTGITITSAGTGYASNPTITISNPTSNAFVEVGATVQLFRTQVDANGNPVSGPLGMPVLVNTLTNTAGGIVAIADINLSTATLTTPGVVIPDGKYVYTAVVTDLAGNVSQMSPRSQVVTIDTSTPPTLAQPVLVSNTARCQQQRHRCEQFRCDGDGDGDDQRQHGPRDRRHVRRLWLHDRARSHAQRRWRQRGNSYGRPDERRGHRDQHHQRRHGLHLGPDRRDREPPLERAGVQRLQCPARCHGGTLS